MSPSCAENPSDFASDFVSMRWSGFVRLDVVETVTFFVETAPKPAGIDGARLWIEGILMVDSTIAEEIQSGAFNVTAASLYSVVLEYRATTGNNNILNIICAKANIHTGNATCRLMYASASITMQPISPSYLFSGSAHANGSPFELYVSPAALCASTSTLNAEIQDMSIWTAGSAVSMTISARDVYGNWKTSSDPDVHQVFVRSQLVDYTAASISGSAQYSQFPLAYSVSVRPSVSGLSVIHASFVLPMTSGRGMHATYYRLVLHQ
jgi:hypothetical protein